MRVFVTGATGFIGSEVVKELLGVGHQVLGLTRSDSGAASLIAAGAEVHRGQLEDVESLRTGAAKADGVIHLAFDHEFANFAANCEKDARAIAAMGDVLKGSDKTLLITSGVGVGSTSPDQPAREEVFDRHHPTPRIASELAGAALSDAGVNVIVVRLPQVHNTQKQGLISPLIELAREKGVFAYVGDGSNRWSAAHRMDVAKLYRLAFEKQQAGARYNAVSEEGVAMRDIAEVIGRGMKIPAVSLTREEAAAHFGWMAMFGGMSLTATSTQTREQLGWSPTGPGLLEDLANMKY